MTYPHYMNGTFSRDTAAMRYRVRRGQPILILDDKGKWATGYPAWRRLNPRGNMSRKRALDFDKEEGWMWIVTLAKGMESSSQVNVPAMACFQKKRDQSTSVGGIATWDIVSRVGSNGECVSGDAIVLWLVGRLPPSMHDDLPDRFKRFVGHRAVRLQIASRRAAGLFP